MKVEGPYGSFTFDEDCPRQIWVGGGIGITPFIGRMKELADRAGARPSQEIDLFHTTADYSEEAIAKLTADAKAANVRLHRYNGIPAAKGASPTNDKSRAYSRLQYSI